MQTRRIGWLWLLPLLASAASCSSSSSDDDAARESREGAFGDGEIAGPSGAEGEYGPALGSPSVAAPEGAVGTDSAGYAGEAAGGDGRPASSDEDEADAPSEDDGGGGATPAPPGDGIAVDPADPEPGLPLPDPSPIGPGTLTVGTWDDNRNFDRFLSYREALHQQNMSGLLDFSAADHEAARDAFAQRAAHVTLDVSLVIDTTGSMGDELSYLQSEFLAISAAIESKYPNAEQRWSLVLYKDEGDQYVARWFDFRDDAEDFRSHLGQQSASGGGDFPEAPDVAFEVMNQLSWRSDPTTARLAFWVADAPHHAEKAAALQTGIEGAEAQDIHIYPVASSGIDELTELTMRSAAQLTGGRYLFLTDDSGVGNSHKEPSIPCYFVTKLDSAILRMVDVEMTGQYREPSAEELVRSSGDPQDGACTLESGQPAFAF